MEETTFHVPAERHSHSMALDIEFRRNPALSRATVESRILSPRGLGVSLRPISNINGDPLISPSWIHNLVESKKEHDTGRKSVDSDDISSVASESQIARAL